MQLTREYTDRETGGQAFEVRASSTRVLATPSFPSHAKVHVDLFVGMHSNSLDLRVALHTSGDVKVTRSHPSDAGNWGMSVVRDEGMIEEIRDFFHRHTIITSLEDRRFQSTVHVVDMLAFEVARKKFKELDAKEQEQEDPRWTSADGALTVERDPGGRPSFHIHTERLLAKEHVIELTEEDIRSLHEGIGWP